MTMQELIARRFSALLRNCLTTAALTDAIAKNKAETNPEVCHTHDHVDANMIMADAFKECMGREIDLQSDADRALWGQAWTLAKQANFYTCPARELKAGMRIDRFGRAVEVLNVKMKVHPMAGAVIIVTHKNPESTAQAECGFAANALIPLRS